jgi:hypothetical protein
VTRIVLTTEEHVTLERWARRPTTAQALALRARLVLRLSLSLSTVGGWTGEC